MFAILFFKEPNIYQKIIWRNYVCSYKTRFQNFYR